MRADRFSLRCYVEREDDVFVAVCVDLALAAQASSISEAKQKLDAQIADYLMDIFKGEDRAHMRDLFPRRSPLRYVARFHWIALRCQLRRVTRRLSGLHGNDRARTFNEFWPEIIRCP